MLTTSNLKLRQTEVKKNINEDFRQMRKQAIGGLGALVEKPNAPLLRKPFTPTIFTPAPMTSSLPYLSDDVKMRSNENVLMLSAHIAQQKEARKASLFLDDKKTAEYQQKLAEDMVVKQNIAPNNRDLLTRYLTGEIQKRQREEMTIEEERRKKIDLIMNPVPPVAPVAKPAGAIGAGDLGAREGSPLERLATSARESVFPNLKNIAEQLLTRRLNDEKAYTLNELKGVLRNIKEQGLNYQLPPPNLLQSRPQIIDEIVKAKRLGYDVPLRLSAPRIPQQVAEGSSRAVGGGSVGGGALASLLKGSLE
jgi:hypothetical protein